MGLLIRKVLLTAVLEMSVSTHTCRLDILIINTNYRPTTLLIPRNIYGNLLNICCLHSKFVNFLYFVSVFYSAVKRVNVYYN